MSYQQPPGGGYQQGYPQQQQQQQAQQGYPMQQYQQQPLAHGGGGGAGPAAPPAALLTLIALVGLVLGTILMSVAAMTASGAPKLARIGGMLSTIGLICVFFALIASMQKDKDVPNSVRVMLGIIAGVALLMFAGGMLFGRM